MQKDINWEMMARDTIKGLLLSEDVNMTELKEKLAELGINETQMNLTNKINRGTFSFSYVLKILKALDLQIMFTEDSLSDKAPFATMNCSEFVKQYGELSKIALTAGPDCSDIINKKVENIRSELLSKIGISDKLIDDLSHQALDEWGWYNPELKESDIVDYYNYVTNEQNVLTQLDNLMLKTSVGEGRVSNYTMIRDKNIGVSMIAQKTNGSDSDLLSNLIFKVDDIGFTTKTSESMLFVEQLSEIVEDVMSEKVKAGSVEIMSTLDTEDYVSICTITIAEASTIVSLWEDVILCHTIEGYKPVEDIVLVRVKDGNE